MPVAQIVAGFTKVFVGEIVEKGKDLPLAIIIPWPKASADLPPLDDPSSYSAGTPRREWTVVSGPPTRGISHVPARNWPCRRRAAITRQTALHAISPYDRQPLRLTITGCCNSEMSLHRLPLSFSLGRAAHTSFNCCSYTSRTISFRFCTFTDMFSLGRLQNTLHFLRTNLVRSF
jgi:hTAFII28-like protein conserved region